MLCYYFDTSIWMDIFENRNGFSSEPIGKYGIEVLTSIMTNGHSIIISDCLIHELSEYYPDFLIQKLIMNLGKNAVPVYSTQIEKDAALKISHERKVSSGDALHALLAKRTNSILISRDNHFYLLDDIYPHFKPEDLL